MRIEWPILECISDKALVKLALYQWDKYHSKLDWIVAAQDNPDQVFIESLEEIDRLMRQAPKHQREVR